MPERSGSGVPTGVTPNRAQGRTPGSVLGKFPGRAALKRLALIALVAGCAWAGWGLGQRSSDRQAAAQRQLQQTVQREVSQLQGRLASGTASSADRQRLLSLLLGLDRQGEAIRLLEQMADQEPERWSLRLLLADLRRNANDRSGAERELRQILNRDPAQIEALQRMALLQLEQGRGNEARAQLQGLLAQAHQPSLQPQALVIGLLLADLFQRQGDLTAAAQLNQQLSQEFPRDARPWLALALVRQQQGDGPAAQRALGQARTRLGGQGSQRLDQVAVSWGLAAFKGPSGAPARSVGTEPGAH
jgi:tetratricopeptide (TPR) repeat protein